jgi:signal transduction histidine kinase
MTARILIFLFVSLHLSNYGYSQQYIDSLETQFILVDNAEKLKILDELIPYYFRNEPMQALKSAEKMQGLAMQVGSKEYELKAQRYLGLSDSRLKSDHEAALQNCYQAEINAKSNGFIEELILTKLAIADIYHQIGNNTKALEYQLDAYHLSDSMKFTHLHSIILNNEARSYIQLEDHEKAELCLKNSLKNAKIYDQGEIIAETHMMFGDLYKEAFNYEMALQHYEKAHEVFVKLQKDILVAISLFKIGNTYFSLDMVDESFQYHLNALAIRNRIKDRTGLAESYNEIGHICIENGEFVRAINNLKLGLANAELINSNVLMQRSFDYLSLAYMGIEDYKNAAIYKNKYSSISELIYSEDNERKIQELNTQNEIARRELQIKTLQEVTERKQQQLATSQKFNITLGLLLVVTAISVFFFIRSYREKRRINKELQAINAKVIKQNEALSELNSTKDKFFSIIGHDLKGPLNSLTAFSQLLINHTASLTEEEIRTIARDLDKSLKNLYELLENLLGWARSQTGRLEFVAENFRISEIIKENIRLLSKAALNKQIKIEMMVDDDLEIYADLNSIKTVIRNLLSNAIKFTPEGGVISIFVDEWKDSVEIGIHDTGVGMSREIQDKIFDISAKHTSLGTNQEKGTGLGLILCKEFIERNQGVLTVESEVNVGSTFKFTLPKLQAHKSTQLEEVNEG